MISFGFQYTSHLVDNFLVVLLAIEAVAFDTRSQFPLTKILDTNTLMAECINDQ